MGRKKASSERLALEALGKEELERLLRQTLDQEPVDIIRLHTILEILEKRLEKPFPVTPEEETALQEDWEERQQLLAKLEPQRPKSRWWPWVLLVALFCTTLMVLPVTKGIGGLDEIVAWWRNDVFQLNVPENPMTQPPEGYEFHTDHPGLQQVYDAVSQIGEAWCTVPMWTPEECQLVELTETESGVGKKVWAVLSDGEENVSLSIQQHEKEGMKKRPKSAENAVYYQHGGMTFCIIHNEAFSTVSWTVGQYECTVITSFNENTVYEIIDSIV